jgi:hypothetical protein
MASDHPTVEVVLQGADVVVRLPDSAQAAMTPEAAERLAQSLLDAAQAARMGGGARKPPFPPSELVSPHGAG